MDGHLAGPGWACSFDIPLVTTSGGLCQKPDEYDLIWRKSAAFGAVAHWRRVLAMPAAVTVAVFRKFKRAIGTAGASPPVESFRIRRYPDC